MVQRRGRARVDNVAAMPGMHNVTLFHCGSVPSSVVFDVTCAWQPFTRQGQQKDDADLRSAGLLHLIEVGVMMMMMMMMMMLMIMMMMMMMFMVDAASHSGVGGDRAAAGGGGGGECQRVRAAARWC